MTNKEIVDKLTKAGRKFKTTDDRRKAELFCVGCDKSFGIRDMYYTSYEALVYCGECAKQFIKPVPQKLSETITVLEDHGNTVVVRYENLRQEEYKQCYFSKKGRFIKIKGKRIYL